MRQIREVSELEDLLLDVRESIECFAHPNQACQTWAKASLGSYLGANASTFSCALRRLARARSWSMPWLRTTERIQVRALCLCARYLSADRQTLKKASWVRSSAACFSPVREFKSFSDGFQAKLADHRKRRSCRISKLVMQYKKGRRAPCGRGDS